MDSAGAMGYDNSTRAYNASAFGINNGTTGFNNSTMAYNNGTAGIYWATPLPPIYVPMVAVPVNCSNATVWQNNSQEARTGEESNLGGSGGSGEDNEHKEQPQVNNSLNVSSSEPNMNHKEGSMEEQQAGEGDQTKDNNEASNDTDEEPDKEGNVAPKHNVTFSDEVNVEGGKAGEEVADQKKTTVNKWSVAGMMRVAIVIGLLLINVVIQACMVYVALRF